MKYQGNVEIKNNKICFSFLDNLDFLNNVTFDKKNCNFFLHDIVEIQSEKSGIPLNIHFLPELSLNLHTQMKIASQKHKLLKIKNNSFDCYFYTLTDFLNDSSVKLFYLWHFSTSPVTFSRQDWTYSHNLGLRDCCLINYFLEIGQNPNFTTRIKTIPEVDSLCSFPKSFIHVRAEYSGNLLQANSLKTQQDFKKLNLFLQNEILVQEKFQCVPKSTNFLYPSSFLNSLRDDELLPQTILDILSKLNYNSLYTVNCKNLFASISISDASFEKFLCSAFFTIVEKQSFLLQSTEKKSNFEIKLLSIEFVF